MANNGMIQNANSALQQKEKPKSIQDYITAMAPGIKAALPSVMTPERFTRIAMSAVSGNKKLQQCDPASFLGAMMTAAQLGLEPNTPLGQAYLIPYGNQCQFQLGYAKDTGTGSRIGGGALSETSMCRQGNPKGLPSHTRTLRKSKIT